MSSVIFYSPQNLLTEPHSRPIIKAINSAMLMVGMQIEQPRMVDYRMLSGAIMPKTTKEAKGIRKLVGELVRGRVSLETMEPMEDIFGDLLGHGIGKERSELCHEELLADAMVMVVAGMNVVTCIVLGML